MGPGAHEAALLVAEMRQLDLQPAFAGPGAPAEDFEDQPGAVEHLGLPRHLQIALLHGRDRVVDDDEFGILFRDQLAEFLDLSGPNSVAGLGADSGTIRPRGDREVDRFGQPFRFRQPVGWGMQLGLGGRRPRLGVPGKIRHQNQRTRNALAQRSLAGCGERGA